jgi:hypothetical protein
MQEQIEALEDALREECELGELLLKMQQLATSNPDVHFWLSPNDFFKVGWLAGWEYHKDNSTYCALQDTPQEALQWLLDNFEANDESSDS